MANLKKMARVVSMLLTQQILLMSQHFLTSYAGKIRKLIVSENDENPLTEVQKSELRKSCPGVVKVQKIDILNFDVIHMEDRIDVVECATDWLYEQAGQVNLVADDEEMKPAMMLRNHDEESAVQSMISAATEKRGAEKTSESRNLAPNTISSLSPDRHLSQANRNLSQASRHLSQQADELDDEEQESDDVIIPDDPHFYDQWALKVDEPGDVKRDRDADLQAAEAWALIRERRTLDYENRPMWDETFFPPPIIVAVFDSGIRYDHEDLKDSMWVNKNEIPGNGIDDDGNGYIDDIHGIDVANNDGDPMDDEHDDSKFGHPGHGTHVAGIIAANANNGVGITGVAGGVADAGNIHVRLAKTPVQIMAIKIASFADCIEGLSYALKHGAKISNWSVGGLGASSYGNNRFARNNNFGAKNTPGFSLQIWKTVFGNVLKYDPDHFAIAAAGNDNIRMSHQTPNGDGSETPNDDGSEMNDESAALEESKKDGDDLEANENEKGEYNLEANDIKVAKKGSPSLPCGVGIDFNVLCVTATNRWDKLGQNANKGAEIVHLAAPGDDILSTHIYDDRRKTPAEFRRLYKQGPIFNHPLEKEFLNYDRGLLGDVSSGGSRGSSSFLGMGAAGSGQTPLPWVSRQESRQEVMSNGGKNPGKKQKSSQVFSKNLLSDPKFLTSKKSSYRSLSGSSFAAPHVTGLAVLLKANRPLLSVKQIKQLIFMGSDKIPEKISGDDVEDSRRLNFFKPLKLLLDRYRFPGERPETMVEKIEKTLDLNQHPGVISTVLQITMKQNKCEMMSAHMGLESAASEKEFQSDDSAEDDSESEKLDSENLLGADLDVSDIAKTRRIDFEEETRMFKDRQWIPDLSPEGARNGDDDMVEQWMPEYKKRPGEIQIWFLNADKERIWTPLDTERIWDPEELLKLGVNPDILPKNDDERYIQSYDKWDPYAAKSANLFSDESGNPIPFFLQLKDQPVPPEARYIAAFTAYIDIEERSCVSDVHCSHANVNGYYSPPYIRASNPQFLTAGAVTELKDDSSTWVEKWRQDESLKVRMEKWWQNFDATYSYTKKDLPEGLFEKEFSKFIYYINVDRVISFIPPVVGEKEITHYNIYKGQWMPCNDNKPVTVEQRSIEVHKNYKMLKMQAQKSKQLERGEKEDNQEGENGEKEDEDDGGKYKGKLCWGFCLPREVVADENEIKHRGRQFKTRKCSRQAVEKEHLPGGQGGGGKSKQVNYREGAFLKSVPAMGYLPPYCTSGHPESGNSEGFFQSDDPEGSGGHRIPQKVDSCDLIKLETESVSMDASSDLPPHSISQVDVRRKNQERRANDPNLWDRYGPSIHTTTHISYDSALVPDLDDSPAEDKDSDLDGSPAEDKGSEEAEGSTQNNEHFWITVTGPGILTVEELNLPSPMSADLLKESDGQNSEKDDDHVNHDDSLFRLLGVETVLSYKGFKFAGSYHRHKMCGVYICGFSKDSSHLNRYPDMVVPAGKHFIEWTKRVTNIKRARLLNDEEKAKLRLKFSLKFHSTARYENIHVHVPDINVKKSRWVDPEDLFRNFNERDDDEDSDIVPSSIIIVPAFRKKQPGLFGFSETFAEADLHVHANGIDIYPPPPGGGRFPSKGINVDKAEFEASPFFDPERRYSNYKGWKKSYEIRVPLFYHFSERETLSERLYKPEAIQFLDTNPEPNAFSGKVKIVAARSLSESLREKKNLRGNRFCPSDYSDRPRWYDNLENIDGSDLWSPSAYKVGKNCYYRVRLSASLHWYDDVHADENLSQLWWKKTKSQEAKPRDVRRWRSWRKNRHIDDYYDRDESDAHYDDDAKEFNFYDDTEWFPNSPEEQKSWNGHYWLRRLLEPQESALQVSDSSKSFRSSFGGEVQKFPSEKLEEQFPYPSSWQKSSGILWEGSCYVIIPEEGYLSEQPESEIFSENVIKSESDEISCTIDMEPVKLAGAKSKKPKKWRLFANERIVPTDAIHLPTVSTLIVPVYDVTVPSSKDVFSLGNLDFFRGSSLIQNFDFKGANQFRKDVYQWDAMSVNVANLVGRHSVGLTGFRWYWENENLMNLEKGSNDKNLNPNSNAIAMIQKKENFLAEAALPLVCPPVFSNADVIQNENNYWNAVSDSENELEGRVSSPIDDNRRFATSPGFPGCEVLGPFAPRCYSSDVYPFGSPFDSCSNGGWEITHIENSASLNSERRNFEDDPNKPHELIYRLKKTIKHQYEDEYIYFPTKGRMVLRDFKINGLKWGSPYLTLRESFPMYGNTVFGQYSGGYFSGNHLKTEEDIMEWQHRDLFHKFMQHINEKQSEGKDPFNFSSSGEKRAQGDAPGAEKDNHNHSENHNDNDISEPFHRFIDKPAAFHFQSGLSLSTNHGSAPKSNHDVHNGQNEDYGQNEDGVLADSVESEEEDYFVIEWMPEPFEQIQNLEDAAAIPDGTPDGPEPDGLEASSSQLVQGLSLNLLNAVSKDPNNKLNMAGSVRVVPVYHNYLNIKQAGDSADSISVTHGIDKDGPRYDIAAFRGPGTSVSLKLKTIEGDCGYGNDVLMEGGENGENDNGEKDNGEKENGEKENGEKKPNIKKREMTCKIPDKLYAPRNNGGIFPNWQLQKSANILDKSELPQYCERSASQSPEKISKDEKNPEIVKNPGGDKTPEAEEPGDDKTPEADEPGEEEDPADQEEAAAKKDLVVKKEESAPFFKFPIGECGSSIHTAFDYATQKVKTFASVLIVHDVAGAGEDKRVRKNYPPLECRCEIKDNDNGSDFVSEEVKDDDSEANVGSEEAKDDDSESNAGSEEVKDDDSESNVGSEEVKEDGVKEASEEWDGDSGDSAEKESDSDSGDASDEKEGDSGDSSEEDEKDSSLEEEKDPGNRRLLSVHQRRRLLMENNVAKGNSYVKNAGNTKRVVWKNEFAGVDLALQGKNTTSEVLKIDLTVLKSSSWAITSRKGMENALKSALLSGCHHPGQAKHVDKESDDIIEKVVITQISELGDVGGVSEEGENPQIKTSKLGSKIEFVIVMGSQARTHFNPVRFQLESRVQLLSQNAPRVVGKFLHGFNHEGQKAATQGKNTAKTGKQLKTDDITFSRHLE